MKKIAIVILLLPLLTGCWDRLPLKDLQLIDIAGFDRDDESGEVVLHNIVTKLKSTGQGGGEPNSEITEFKGHSLVEAVGQSDYSNQGPFLAISTGVYLLSKKFASNDPVKEFAFLLHAPYSSINTPIVIVDENMSKFFKSQLEEKKDFTKEMYDFVRSLEKKGIALDVPMMKFIQSRDQPLEDLALPVLKNSNGGIVLSGANLFRQGKNTSEELNKDQVEMLMLMLGKSKGSQKITGSFSEDSEENSINYAFSIKKLVSKIKIHSDSNKLIKVKIDVKLKINVFEIGESFNILKPDYVNRMEKELGKLLEEDATATIDILQKANTDILGIGKQLKAYHPNVWKTLNWDKEFPGLSIEPSFDVKILNTDAS